MVQNPNTSDSIRIIINEEWARVEREHTLFLLLQYLTRTGIVTVTDDGRIVWSNGEDVRYG